MAWGVGGWLLTPFLQSAGAETIGRLRARVAAELTTTFASTYTREVSLAGMLKPDAFQQLRQASDQGEVPRYSASATVTATRANDYWFSCVCESSSRAAL